MRAEHSSHLSRAPRRCGRRALVVGAGAAAAGGVIVRGVGEASAAPRRNVAYPPVDLRYFDKPITPVPFPIAFGYAQITWGDDTTKGIDEIADIGFRGVQLRAVAMKEFADPAALRERLAARRLSFVCYSGGSPNAENVDRAGEIETFMKGATYARAAGSLFIQATSPGRKKVTVDGPMLRRFGQFLTELGRRTADLGLPLAFHNHMDHLGESAAEVDAIMAAADPRFVKLLLDVGHYQQAGGDPAKAIRTYKDRLVMMHLKDVGPKPDGKGYSFVELGAGKVDFPAVFAALADVKYRGWAVVELDSVPKERAPKDAAIANKAYLEKTAGVTV